MMTTDLSISERDLRINYGENYLGEEVSPLALASVKYIYTDLTDIRKYYIRLGFHLDEFDKNKGSLDFGFATLEDFCAANIGFDKSAVSRCINVFREFNAGDDVTFGVGVKSCGCAMDLSDRWKNYSYSQLVEMLPLAPEDRDRVLPSMSCKQIREFKKQLKQKKKSVAATQPETPEEELAKQKKIFDCVEYARKSGIVAQNYIKSCTQLNSAITIQIFDNRGKEIVSGLGGVLERSGLRLVIRMQEPFDPVSSLDCKQPDQKEEKRKKTKQDVLVYSSSARPYVALLVPNSLHEEYLNAFAKYFISCEKKWMDKDFEHRVSDVTTSPSEIKNHLKPQCRTWNFKVNEGVAKINLFDDYVQLYDEHSVYMGNFEWFYLAAAIQRMWNVVVLEKINPQLDQKGDRDE